MHPTRLSGARTHNLRGIGFDLAPGQVVAITGISGAGKSSLALDTLYAEGQRRFVESFSPYARQFLERLERPPIDRLDPVAAGIAVDRRAPVKSSRSTVATMADLEPYLAALFTREAVPVCPRDGAVAVQTNSGAAAARVLGEWGGRRAVVTYPVRVSGTEGYLDVRESLARDGYRRLWVDGEAVDIDSLQPSRALSRGGSLDVVVDRLRVERADEGRLAAAIEQAFRRAGSADIFASSDRLGLREGLCCPTCQASFEPPRPGLFSYESPLGACQQCRGFGRTIGVDLDKVIPDPSKSLAKGAIKPWRGASTSDERGELSKFCKRHRIDAQAPWSALSAAEQRLVTEGDGSWDDGLFPGVLGWFRWLETKTYKMHVRVLLSRYRSYDQCRACAGRRLNATALSYVVGGRSLAEWHALEVADASALIATLKTSSAQGELVRRELQSRLTYLDRVGLGYLSLDRQSRTLSGGEAQRVTLTAALGTSLHNALFVLDEPSVGLHPSDIVQLNGLVAELAARGNTVLLVEHDPILIGAADRVIELGPGAGTLGGEIVCDGTPDAVRRQGGATARALAATVPLNKSPRAPRAMMRVRGARAHNLGGFDVDIPLGVVCAITGPSGSGKSTLAVDILYRALARRFGAETEQPAAHTDLQGAEALRSVTLVDQAPLGRTSRGNAATYTKAWDAIRALFAKEPAAEALELTASDFSFNVEGGRCDTCSGEGFETVEMQFLADVRLACPVCGGRRFKEHVLRVQHRGLNVAELLDSTVERVLETFRSEPAVVRALSPLSQLGLQYLRLGQPLSTLSGGEAQRLKLARALSDELAGTLLILDEPSAGLHADEVGKLVAALRLVVDAGASVIVVEHDLDVIASADHVIDLGPGGGHRGGQIVATGTPVQVAESDTRTALALRDRGRRVSPRAKVTRQQRRDAAALVVERAREHNLQDVSVSIPHGSLTVVTGPSGSGKSTLAFDVVFAEGQRRFLETLTPYARQFLPTMPRPDVDSVTGVPPSIALEQRTSRAGVNSTVATVTEVAHYLRLLFAKLGVPHCPAHGAPIGGMDRARVVAAARAVAGKQTLLAPVVQARKGTYLDVFNAAHRDGIAAAYCDGELVATDDPPRLRRNKEHTIDLVLSRTISLGEADPQLFERALRWGDGSIKLRAADGRERLLSTKSSCPQCGFSVPELDPRWFSFNTAQGRCETCEGAGYIVRERKTRGKKTAEAELLPCSECAGARLAAIPRAVRLNGDSYDELVQRPVSSALERLRSNRFEGDAGKVAAPILTEIVRRLGFMQEVGLEYLSLGRAAITLSGGEMQRLRLAAQLGAGLTGALYVLDEPTVGLHPRDTARLLGNLKHLVELGSTVLVVEHDADTIRAADHLIDLGPAGGSLGGRIIAAGSPASVLQHQDSPTGRALSVPDPLRTPLPIVRGAREIVVEGAREHNLKRVSARFPVARLSVVAGVSGSGKSTLVRKVLLPAVREHLGLATPAPGAHDAITGLETLRRAIAVDQSPIGRTPRSIPATFLGIWDHIRALFAATTEAKIAGFDAARFSFNTPRGGRCPTCDGQGVITHEMSFLPDVVTPCGACQGQRFEPHTLAIRYLGLSVGDVLALTLEQASKVFENHPAVAAPLKTLTEMGAGYIKLGQGSHTLSGGEAQRLKLAAELTASARHEATLYVLDEPTTGLHLADVSKLMGVLGRLVERGDTLVVVEHHPVVIAGADWLVELGPEGGTAGGRIVACGPPALVARKATATGAVLSTLLNPATAAV